MNPNLIDRVFLQLAPRMALKRLRARAAAGVAMRHFEAAQSTWRTENWRRISSDPNAAGRAALHTLRDQARDLVRNNGWARRAKQVIANNSVGWGIVPTPVESGSRAMKRARNLVRRWGGSKQCDLTGQLTLYGMQRLAMDTVAQGGEVLVRRYRQSLRMGLAIPLQLQLLEPDHLDTGKDEVRLPGGGFIIQGVEFDADGRRVAYWLFPKHPGSSFQFGSSQFLGVSERVSADDVASTFYIERPGQVRGVSWYAPAIVPLKEFDEFEDAQLLRQKIAACFAAFVTDTDGTGFNFGEKKDAITSTIDPGSVHMLPGGKGVEIADPPQVADGGFDERTLRKICAAMGVTYEDVSGDYSQVNFSSARMARLAHWANVYDWQFNMLIPGFCDVIWGWAMEAALISGTIGETPAAEWTPRPMPIIDPDKEAKAALLMVRAGMRSPDDVVREQGFDPDVFWPQYTASFARLRGLGIVLDTDAAQRTQVGNAVMKPTARKPAS